MLLSREVAGFTHQVVWTQIRSNRSSLANTALRRSQENIYPVASRENHGKGGGDTFQIVKVLLQEKRGRR